MAKLTRRGLIKRVTVGMGAVGVIAATSTLEACSSNPAVTKQTATQQVKVSGDSLVACVTDAATGTIVLMRGEREVTVTSPDIVQSLLSL